LTFTVAGVVDANVADRNWHLYQDAPGTAPDGRRLCEWAGVDWVKMRDRIEDDVGSARSDNI
jgi:hypothetical protein